VSERALRRHRWTNLAPAPFREGVRAVTAASEPELLIYDYIDSWGGEWGVSAAEVLAALDVIGDVPALTVRLSSPGGDYFEGVSIHNALLRHPATVTVHVDALAASAASVIAMAGDRVVMGQGAQIMIHEAASAAFGRADDMRACAVMLDQTNDDIAGFYAARTGGDVAAWREAVRQETWYTAAQAVAAGLADEVATPPARVTPPAEAPAAAAPALPNGNTDGNAARPAAPHAGSHAGSCGGPCSTSSPTPDGSAPQQPAEHAKQVPADAAPETSAPEAEAPPAPEPQTAAVNLADLVAGAIREGVTL